MSAEVSLSNINLNDNNPQSEEKTTTMINNFDYHVSLSEEQTSLDFVSSDPSCPVARFSLNLEDILWHKTSGDSEIICYFICRGKNYVWKLLCFKVTFNPNSEKFQLWISCLDRFRKKSRKLLFIVNPVCGNKTAKSYFINRVEPLLKQLEMEYKVIYTQKKDEATEICEKLRENNEESFEGVVVLSGDGTLNEALRGLMSVDENLCLKPSPIPVGIIPCGTSNTLAYTIHGNEDPDTAVLHILMGDQMKIDVLGVTDDKENLLGFSLTMIAFGFIADAIQASEKFRFFLKDQLRYTIAFAKVILKLRKYNTSLTLWQSPKDDHLTPQLNNHEIICQSNCNVCSESVHQNRDVTDITVFDESNLFFANFYNHPGRCRLAPHGGAPYAHIGDGLLHIRIAGDITRGQAANILKGTGDTKGPQKPPEFLKVTTANKVKFQHNGEAPKNGCLILDGEIIFANEVSITCHHQALSFFARGLEERLPDEIMELCETENPRNKCLDSCIIL